MRVTANTALSNIPSQTTVNSNSPSTASIIRNSSPSPFSSALLQQLSRSNTFQTFIHSLSNSSSSRNDGFDDLLNSRVLQQATTNRQSQPSRTGSVNLHRRSTIRDPSRTKRGVKNANSTTGEFPLSFDIVYCDGGYYSEAYNVENILRNDNHVYCSSKSANINILLRFNDHNQDNNMETTFVLSKIIVKAPTQGYTAPCKEGLIFVSHEPISLEATSTYDDFTESDFQDLLKSGENGRIEDSWPAAYFRLDTNITMQTVYPNRSGKFIFVKLLRSEGDEENIDLQYLGFIGFTGPRSFDSGTLR